MESKESDNTISSGSSDRKRKADDATVEDPQPKPVDSDEDEENATDDTYVTMVDVLEEEKQLEEEAFALLGGSDDKNCTYLHGYVGRQAIYACKTCHEAQPKTLDQSTLAGICLACSYACHEGHELYELYTKRNFKCDCGNAKTGRLRSCKLFPNKSDYNELNQYNHNFAGRYCMCGRPYPDPDPTIDYGTMIQCVVCEDWYHEKCLNTDYPPNEEFEEMICGACMLDHPFLWSYQTEEFRLKRQRRAAAILEAANDPSSSSEKPLTMEDPCIDEYVIREIEKESDPNRVAVAQANNRTGEPASDSGIENSCDSMADQCKLKVFEPRTSETLCQLRRAATFWNEGWRSRLCRCLDCLALYRREQVEFLCDETDTVHHYEAKGKEKGAQMSQYERGLNEINKMDRVQSIEAITECNAMTSHFKQFLKKFAENKKVVRQKDIEQFFEELKLRKRQRTEEPLQF